MADDDAAAAEYGHEAMGDGDADSPYDQFCPESGSISGITELD